MKRLILTVMVAAIFTTAAEAQYVSYYGFGALQSTFQTFQRTSAMANNCTSLERQFGKAKTLAANPDCKQFIGDSSSTAPSRDNNGASKAKVTQTQASSKYLGRFRPGASVDAVKTVAEALSNDPAERAQFTQIISAVKDSYDQQAKEKGWGNNAAGGMTFFIFALTTVYFDSADMSDEKQAALFEVLNQSFDTTFAKMSDKDKQYTNDLLICLAAIPLATYLEAKQTGDAKTLETAQKLAGQIFESVFKSKPMKLN